LREQVSRRGEEKTREDKRDAGGARWEKRLNPQQLEEDKAAYALKNGITTVKPTP